MDKSRGTYQVYILPSCVNVVKWRTILTENIRNNG